MEIKGTKVILKLPESSVIYLDPKSINDKLEMVIRFPDGREVPYYSKPVNVQQYSKDDIFNKKLLLFLPFYRSILFDMKIIMKRFQTMSLA